MTTLHVAVLSAHVCWHIVPQYSVSRHMFDSTNSTTVHHCTVIGPIRTKKDTSTLLRASEDIDLLNDRIRLRRRRNGSGIDAICRFDDVIPFRLRAHHAVPNATHQRPPPSRMHAVLAPEVWMSWLQAFLLLCFFLVVRRPTTPCSKSFLHAPWFVVAPCFLKDRP